MSRTYARYEKYELYSHVEKKRTSLKLHQHVHTSMGIYACRSL